jgi:hypothetical protein
MSGRVIGAVVALATALAPLGMLIAGVAIEALGIGPTLIVVATGTSLAGLTIARNPVLAELDAPAA